MIRRKDTESSMGLVRAKMWKHIGHVTSMLTNYTQRNFNRNTQQFELRKPVPENWEIVEYELVPKRVIPAKEYYERALRQAQLVHDLGAPVGRMLGKLDETGEVENFRWCITLDKSEVVEKGFVARINAALKKMQLTKDDYRSNGKGTWVFKEKRHAMTVKLMVTKKVRTIDLSDYVEKAFELTDKES